MMKYILFFGLIVSLFSCGSGTKNDDPVVLNSYKDSLSYVLGAINAQSIVGANDPKIMKLDMELIAKGFEDNLNDKMPADCEGTLKKLFGPYFQDFDSTYAAPGAECLGRLTAFSFYREMKDVEALNKIDLKLTVQGFRHGLLKKDSVIPESAQKQLFSGFIKEVEQVMYRKNREQGEVMLADAAKLKGVQIFENGIILQQLKAGGGGSPAATDDVKIEYILLNAKGDTLQSTYDIKKMTGSKDPVSMSLQGVIPAWTYALPKMKKGGTYKLFVPWKEAYGEQGMYNPQTQSMDIKPYESLCFVIELIDFAKAGTFVKPQKQPEMGMP
jgi:FKBP-type peptidyl-prolyl cis-trans isomerase